MQEPIRVIVIDDDPKMAGLLPRVLAVAGIRALTVCTSAEELMSMQDTVMYREAELFVLDVRLPKMTGVELARKLRDEGEERPILAVSAWSEEAGWELTEMKVEYLQKPFVK